MFGKNRWKIATLFCVALIFIAFVAFHSSGQSKRLSVPKASSMAGVKHYQYEHVPGLQRAEQLGLTKNYHVTLPIPGTSRTLKVGEIWYSSGYAYLFYSINALPLKKPSNPKAFSRELPGISCAVSPGKGAQDSVCMEEGNGIAYKGRLFRYIRFEPFENDKGTGLLRKINQITLKRMDVFIGSSDYPMQNISLPLGYSPNKKNVKSFKIHKRYKLADGDTLILDSFQMGAAKNQLSLYFVDPNTGENLRNVALKLRTVKGLQDKLMKMNKQGSHLEYVLFPFNKVPKAVKLKINGIEMIENDFFSFTIDVSRLKKTRKPVTVHRKIAERQDTNIYLEKIHYDNNGLWVQIRYVPKRKNQKIHLAVEAPHFPGQNWMADSKTPLLIEARNMKKNAYAFGGHTGSGPGPVYDFQFDSSFINRSNKIQIVIQNIPFTIEVNKDVKIPLSR